MSTFSETNMTSITGEPVALSTFEGQVTLIVNVASK